LALKTAIKQASRHVFGGARETIPQKRLSDALKNESVFRRKQNKKSDFNNITDTPIPPIQRNAKHHVSTSTANKSAIPILNYSF